MAAFLPFGGGSFPSQGSRRILEQVKHFTSEVSFDDLQVQINIWLIFISSDVIINRPSIREISFSVIDKAPPGGGLIYYAQVHLILVGDATNPPI